MGVTLRHLFDSVRRDLGPTPRVRNVSGSRTAGRDNHGVFTVQYPEEQIRLPENFRYFPVLIVDDATGVERCTACGICAKACPPQCIWIARSVDEAGKPVPRPAEFIIDESICMQCGFCAEYCPFDAIKMDHRFELATVDRLNDLVRHKPDLLVPEHYYASIHPTDYANEKEARRQEAAAKAAKAGAGARE